jgi:hypothetical protein
VALALDDDPSGRADRGARTGTAAAATGSPTGAWTGDTVTAGVRAGPVSDRRSGGLP